MVVIAEPDAEVGGALADLRQHSSQALVVGVCDRTVFRFLIQHLKIKAAYIVHEFCIGSMQHNLILLDRRIDIYIPARERDHHELMFLQ